MVLKQVLSRVNKMQKNHLQGSWDCLGETGKKWWDGEKMVDRKNFPGARHHCAHRILTWVTGESGNRSNRGNRQ